MAERKRKPIKSSGGRPTVMTPITIAKLEEVFAIGGSDKEACFYADIAPSTLYEHQLLDPSFVERKEALKMRPILKARQTVVKSLDDPDRAFRYLERKVKEEFSQKQEIDHNNPDGNLKSIIINKYGGDN